MTTVPHYATFGGCLRSDELFFPELPLSDATVPDWSLHVADVPAKKDVEVLLGTGLEQCGIQLYQIHDGFRLRHSCTGEFDITTRGTQIVWYPRLGANPEMARNDILGRVLSVALHAAGALTLHGSAVAFEQSAVAFLAPKGYGKSTLAAALLQGGARLATDDTVAVELGPPPLLRSGVHSMRLCNDSAEKFLGEDMPRRSAIDGKHVVDHTRAESVMLDQTQLSAIYLLQPVSRGREGPAACRRRLPASHAAISLLSHAKIGTLLGKFEASTVFERTVTLASSVPVYSLEITRDFDKMDDVVERILDWHSIPDMVV